MTWSIEQADVLDWCEGYAAKIKAGEASPFHAILTDPSYGLGNNPDIEALLTAWMSDEDYDTGPGFMGRDWDQLPGPRYWRALRRVCHPGAYLFAFGGTRTADLLSVAIRLGGWERWDEIDSLSWTYGSGFPKSTNIGKKVDAAAGMEREVIGKRTDINHGGGVGTFDDDAYIWKSEMNVTVPATPLAARWNGHGTAMKPSHEPILCFRAPLAKVPSDRIRAVTGWDWWHSEKLLDNTPQTRLKMLRKWGVRLPPLYGEADLVLITRKALHEGVETDKLFVARAKRQWREAPTEPVTLARVGAKAYRRWSSKTYAANCLSTGAGALWIDGARVATGDTVQSAHNVTIGGNGIYGGGKPAVTGAKPGQGRWPPNVCLQHIPPAADGFPGCQPLGVRRVRGISGGGGPTRYGSQNRSNEDTKDYPDVVGYAAPDGTEPQQAWACALACECGHQWAAEQRGACPECGGEARWQCPVGALGEQSGERKSGGYPANFKTKQDEVVYGDYAGAPTGREKHLKSQGTATRFYPNFSWQHEVAERLAGVTPFYYCAKSARRERDAGLEGLPSVKVGIGDDRPSGTSWERRAPEKNPNYPRRNGHPCVKPLSLLIWLCKLLSSPPEYAPRRLLVPFAGSGSECAAAVLSGQFEEIVGVELDEGYTQIAEARLRFWAGWAGRGYDDPKAILAAAKKEEKQREKAQMELAL